MKVIWSYGQRDPESISQLASVQHTSLTRGSRSMQFLHSDSDIASPTLPEDAVSIDVRMRNVSRITGNVVVSLGTKVTTRNKIVT